MAILLAACSSGGGVANIPANNISLKQACSYAGTTAISTADTIMNAIPARTQWNENSGYCGETSLISAGLYYGQYVSQYTARELGDSVFDPPETQINGQLLIGTYGNYGPDHPGNSIVDAARQMHLDFEEYNNLDPTKPSTDFLAWVKHNIVAKYPVIIGVYENASIFGQLPDPEYDHIVPVFGVSSKSLTGDYNDGDIFYIHDNGLYTGAPGLPSASDVGCYQYLAESFQNSRESADKSSAGVYSVSNNSNQDGNYGITITGVRAKNINLLPVSIQTDPTYEIPEIKHHSTIQPLPESMTLYVTVSGMMTNTRYVLLKYNDFDNLPVDDDFSTSVGTPLGMCEITLSKGDSFSHQEIILSNQIVIYRAALKSALPITGETLLPCQ